MDTYDDIINMQNPEPKNRKRMSIENRAAQFSSFAALKGHYEAIEEASRIVYEYKEIDEDTKNILDRKLQILKNDLVNNNNVYIKYFEKDSKKDGGNYIDIYGYIDDIDYKNRTIILQDGRKLYIDNIRDIDADIFDF